MGDSRKPEIGNHYPILGAEKGAAPDDVRSSRYFPKILSEIMGNLTVSKMDPLFKLIASGGWSNFG